MENGYATIDVSYLSPLISPGPAGRADDHVEGVVAVARGRPGRRRPRPGRGGRRRVQPRRRSRRLVPVLGGGRAAAADEAPRPLDVRHHDQHGRVHDQEDGEVHVQHAVLDEWPDSKSFPRSFNSSKILLEMSLNFRVMIGQKS